MGDRYIKSNENKKIFYIDANNLYGWAMSQYLPYDDIKFDNKVKLDDILHTPDDSEVGYFVEVDLKYPNNIKQKDKIFSHFVTQRIYIQSSRKIYKLYE